MGMTVLSISDAETALEEKEKNEGVTTTIKSGEAVSWNQCNDD